MKNLIEWTITVWLSICIFASCSENKDTPIIDGTDTIVIEDFFGLNPAEYDDLCRTSTEVYPVKRMDDMIFMMYHSSDEEKLKADLAQAGIISYGVFFEDMNFGALGFDINGSAEKYTGVKSAYVEGSYQRMVPYLRRTVTAAPFYSCNTGQKWTDMIIFQEFTVILKDEEDFSKLEQLANAYSVEIVQKIALSEIAYNLFCTNSSKGNALQMANLFYETGLFKEVFVGMQTDFLQFMADHPGIVIDTPTGYFEEPVEDNTPSEVDTSIHLAGTQWKLVGLVDHETGDLQEFEPKDCDDCYTLVFDTDTTAQGKSYVNLVVLLGLHPIKIQCGTEAGDCVGNQPCFYYCDLLRNVVTYDVKNNGLIIYLRNKNYLLYKIIKT
ncbi:MAG: hypothetical protein LBE91_04115 [Tannerella sp.]|jgi:hypothetical protein|nr:hypothetical protein [Tannerella sp.]